MHNNLVSEVTPTLIQTTIKHLEQKDSLTGIYVKHSHEAFLTYTLIITGKDVECRIDSGATHSSSEQLTFLSNLL